MTIIKKNSFFIFLAITAIIIILFIKITTPSVISYEEIRVEYGDSLWSLAEKYHGEFSPKQWIKIVQVENNMYDYTIIAGEPIIIPLTSNVTIQHEIHLARKDSE